MSATRIVLRHIRQQASKSATDAALLRQFIERRDNTAFECIIQRHGSMVLSVCRRRLDNLHAAEDAFQATFLALSKSPKSIRQSDSLAGWLFRTAQRIAGKACASARRRTRTERQSARQLERDPRSELSARELLEVLDGELGKLSERDWLPLLLVYWQGRSYAQAARELNVSTSALHGRLERGRQRLAERLQSRGFSPGDLGAVLAATTTIALPTDLIARTAALTASGAIVPAGVAALAATSLVSTNGVIAMTTVVMLAGSGIFGLAGGIELGANPAIQRSLVNELSAEPMAQPPTDSVTVRGRVLDPNGKPTLNAVIYTLKLLPGKNPYPSHENVDVVSRGKTDANGEFQFEIPREKLLVEHNRSWPVMAAANGFGLGWTRGKKPSDDLNIQLPKEQNVYGRVVDTEGRPIPNAEMHIRGLYTGADDRLDAFLNEWKANWDNSWSFVNKRTVPPKDGVTVNRTNQKGEFKISGVGADQVVNFELKAPGYAQMQGYIVNRNGLDPKPLNQIVNTPRPGEKYIEGQLPTFYGPKSDIEMKPSRSILGVVRDADGKPLAGVEVWTLPSFGVRVSTVSDDNGRFTLSDLPKRAEYLVHVSNSAGESTRSRNVQLFDTEGLTPIRADIRISNH